MRVKRGVTTHKRHKKLLASAKGYRGGRSKLVRLAKEAVKGRPPDRARRRPTLGQASRPAPTAHVVQFCRGAVRVCEWTCISHTRLHGAAFGPPDTRTRPQNNAQR